MHTDNVTPTGAWTFDDKVTDAFDDMLARSIPAYDSMRDLTTRLAVHYAQQNPTGRIVDLGCSRGRALLPVAQQLGTTRSYLGTDVSAPMRAAARTTLARYVDAGACEIRDTDLRTNYPDDAPAAVTLSVLTLQFTPIEYRHSILRRAHDNLVPGGALLLVEKVLGDDFHLDSAFTACYRTLKGSHGYTPHAIQQKAASLEGVLVPVTAGWNRDLLRSAGFTHVDSYWRAFNFAAWVAVR